MDCPFHVELTRMREIASQRAEGESWQKIAEAFPIEETKLRQAVENTPAWEGLLVDARQKALASAAMEAVRVLQQALHSENETIRMQAAAQLLRFYMATIRQKPKAKSEEEPDYDRQSEFRSEQTPIAPESVRDGERLQGLIEPLEFDLKGTPALQPTSVSVEISNAKPAEPAIVPSSNGHARGKVDFRRNLLIAPLLSANGIPKPANGKPR